MKKVVFLTSLISILVLTMIQIQAFELYNIEYDDYVILSTGTKVPIDYIDPYNLDFQFPKYYINDLTDEEIKEVSNLQDEDIVSYQSSHKNNNNGEWASRSFYNGNLKENYNTKRIITYTAKDSYGNPYAYFQPMLYFTYKGEIAYCMEADLGLSGNGWSTNGSESGNRYSELSNKQKKAVDDYAVFGTSKAIDYKNSSSTTYDYRMYYVATQILIWQVTNNLNITSSSYASNNPNTSIQTYMNGITSYKTKNQKIPSFASKGESGTTPIYTLKWNSNSKRYEVKLTDTNGVWDSNFSWYGKLGNYTLSNPSGANNLLITTDVISASSNTTTFNKNNISNFSYDPYNTKAQTSYINGNGSGSRKNQDLVTAKGLGDPIDIKFGVKSEVKTDGSVKLVKKNQYGEFVEGVKFEIYNKNTNKLVKLCTTNSAGYCTISNLKYGNYYVREVSSTNPDIILQTDANDYWSFNILSSTQVVKTIINQQIRGDVFINKVNQNDVDLVGVEFGLYNKGNDLLLETCTTDMDGSCSFLNLSGGSYYVKEIRAPRPDIELSNEIYSFEINKPSQIININNGKVINQQWAEIKIDELYSEIHNEQVSLGISAEDDDNSYIDSTNHYINLIAYENGEKIATQKVDLNNIDENIKDVWYQYLIMDIPITEEEQNITLSFENIGVSKYRFEELSFTRYNRSNNDVYKNTSSGEVSLNDGLNPVYSYYHNDELIECSEKISFEGFDYQNVVDGLVYLNGSFDISINSDDLKGSKVYNQKDFTSNLFDSSFNVLDKYNPESIQMTMPLEDITMMYEYDDGYTYNMIYDENGKLYLDNIVMEKYNGRIYNVNSDLYKNPTDNHATLELGYLDKNDEIMEINDVYPLPVYNTFEMQKKEYDYHTTLKNIGVNNITLDITSQFYFDTKKYSTQEDYGLNQINLLPVSKEEASDIISGDYNLGTFTISGDEYKNIRDVLTSIDELYISDVQYLNLEDIYVRD